MVRTSNAEQPTTGYANSHEWPAQSPASGKPSVEQGPDSVDQPNHTKGEQRGDVAEKRGAVETDSWDFNDASFPDTAASTQPQQVSSHRPDTDVFPTAESIPRSPNRAPLAHRRKSSSSMARRRSAEHELSLHALGPKTESANFKLKFGLRGHLDTVRTVIFSGGGSPGEPEICTAGDDGTIKRFHIPDRHPGHTGAGSSDLDVTADFTHRGHSGAVLSLTSWSPSPNFSTGGRAQGDGWIFSGGQDATIRVWERGRVDPKSTLDGHTDAVWALCVLPTNLGTIFGQSNAYGTPDRILLVSGAADGTVKVWAVSSPPQLTSPQPAAGRRAQGGRVRGNSMSSGSAFPNSPQPSTASNSPFHQTLIHSISRPNSKASPTCITPLSPNGETFVVSYSDAAIIVYDTRSGEEIGNMASLETYDGTVSTSVNAVVATTVGLDQQPHQGLSEEDTAGGGPTGGGRAMAGSGVEGVIISGHEDCYVRFFDANSGKLSCISLSLLVWTKLTPLVQANARITWSLTLLPSPAFRLAPMALSWSVQGTMPRCDFGRSRSDRVLRRSPATASCAAKASAQLCGARTAGGWSAAAVTVLLRCLRGRACNRLTMEGMGGAMLRSCSACHALGGCACGKLTWPPDSHTPVGRREMGDLMDDTRVFVLVCARGDLNLRGHGKRTAVVRSLACQPRDIRAGGVSSKAYGPRARD